MIPWRVRQALERFQDRTADLALSLVTRRIPLPASVSDKAVALIGASVGKDWRLHLVFPRIRAFATYEFDKTPLLERALEQRFDAIIIKECAAYFPSPAVKRELVERWVAMIRRVGVRPVLATVVPVTRRHAEQHPGRAAALWAFNDWLRERCASEGVPLLDLEAALRCSPADRHLDDRLDSGDGMHLSRRTYREHMDSLIPPLLLRTFADD
jgi:hypothetical protein